MTSGGNNFNDFPENQLTKFQLGGKNVTILHTIICCTISIPFVHGRKTGHLASREEAGTRDNEAKIRDVPENTGRLATLLPNKEQ